MCMSQRNILLAGATGYLGSYLLKALVHKEHQVLAIVRNPKKIHYNNEHFLEIKQAKLTNQESLRDICKGIHTVISTVGITRQKDGLTYMDVDYQANKNLLDEAKKSGVQHFVYVSAIDGDKYRHLKIFEAKERFVDDLKKSGLAYTIIRPNGFFSDMNDFLQMAKSGRVYLFGKGNQKFNPIHGEDLADFIVDTLDDYNKELTIGGPDILSLNAISGMAFSAVQRPLKITYLPDGLRKISLWVLRSFTNVKTYGPIEFFLTLMAEDHVAPVYGTHHLKDFYKQEASKL